MVTVVLDNPDESRFEIHVDGQLAGYVDYTLDPGVISYHHTVVLEAFAGRGIAQQLVADVLGRARSRGLAVLPVAVAIGGGFSHSAADYLDLVPEGRRAEFRLPA